MKAGPFLIGILDPAIAVVRPLIGVPNNDQSRLLLLVTAGQEGDWRYRRQMGGPARSFWQCEQGGAVADVMARCPTQLRNLCTYLAIDYDKNTIFEAMAWNDTLAVGIARLEYWLDPKPLPAIGDVDGSWDYYLKNWRPGAPRPKDWPSYYAAAMAACGLTGMQRELPLT
jgi:hypothetical protein